MVGPSMLPQQPQAGSIHNMCPATFLVVFPSIAPKSKYILSIFSLERNFFWPLQFSCFRRFDILQNVSQVYFRFLGCAASSSLRSWKYCSDHGRFWTKSQCSDVLHLFTTQSSTECSHSGEPSYVLYISFWCRSSWVQTFRRHSARSEILFVKSAKEA